MKKLFKLKAMLRIAGIIALAAVIGFSMIACDGGGDPETYDVTVNGGTGSGSYEVGDTVNITATVPSGKQFVNWSVTSGGAALDDKNSPNTTFIMPSKDVTVTANFSGGSNPSTSLDGEWVRDDNPGVIVTVSGSSGIYSSIDFTTALSKDAVSKGYITINSQALRNLTSSGNLTWSGQYLMITFNTSSPDVATGTVWRNVTITMSSNEQNITVSGTTDSGTAFTSTFTRQ